MTHSGKAHLSLSQSLRVRIVGGWDSEEEKSLGTYAWEASMPKKSRLGNHSSAQTLPPKKALNFPAMSFSSAGVLGKKLKTEAAHSPDTVQESNNWAEARVVGNW